MVENQATGDGTAGAAGENGGAAPQISINAQYVKDLSFENPNAPQSLAQQEGHPEIQVNVDVQARAVGQGVYETALRINAGANRGEEKVFVVEMVYAGIFTLHNIPQENHELVCLVECPRLMFPFARRVISDAVRDGGFPPLFLEPIDFADLYRRHREGAAAQGGGVAQEAAGGPGV